ncbi:MAG TPA: DoxX family protein [Actinocrinis sp.]
MSSLERAQGLVLSLFRAIVGFLFMCHGLSSMFGVLGGAGGKGGTVEVGAWPGWWAALIQLVCGALVLVGLVSRPAAVLGSGSMAYAYFSVHAKIALFPIQNSGEASVMFCWTLLLIALLGAGPWSLDNLVSRFVCGPRATAPPLAAHEEHVPASSSASA